MDGEVSLMFPKKRSQWAMLRRLYHPITRNMPDGTTVQTVWPGRENIKSRENIYIYILINHLDF